jgi:hypothetical protein
VFALAQPQRALLYRLFIFGRPARTRSARASGSPRGASRRGSALHERMRASRHALSLTGLPTTAVPRRLLRHWTRREASFLDSPDPPALPRGGTFPQQMSRAELASTGLRAVPGEPSMSRIQKVPPPEVWGGLECTVTSRQRLDIVNCSSVDLALREVRPWAVINTGGYVRVPVAERDRERCMRRTRQARRGLRRPATDAAFPSSRSRATSCLMALLDEPTLRATARLRRASMVPAKVSPRAPCYQRVLKRS